MPGIYLYNDELLNAPHIMLNQEEYAGDEQLPKGIYRWICLYEQNSVVWSLMGHEEKIYDAINRLIELLSMTEKKGNMSFKRSSSTIGILPVNKKASIRYIFKEMMSLLI